MKDNSAMNNNCLEIDTIKVESTNSKKYVSLMSYIPNDEREVQFKRELCDAISIGVNEFHVPICDPSINEQGGISFVPGNKPALGYSFTELQDIAKKNDIRLGTKEEYYLFVGTIILSLISQGWSEKDAWHAVCSDSRGLGHYSDSENAKRDYEVTGSRKVAGKCDLANTFKILAKTRYGNSFLIASGNCNASGFISSIATTVLSCNFENPLTNAVGWFVF